ncbi:MAG: class I SAM-dependent methyltransferase, partial [Bdellovibrionales bacterium]
AEYVVAVDASSKMLEEATNLTNDSCIAYVHSPMEQYVIPNQSFDLIVSSMALHYVSDYHAVVTHVFEGLKNGGSFVFSVEHPVCTANPTGWVLNESGDFLYWSLDHYQEEGQRHVKWFVEGIEKHHRTIQTYVSGLLEAGFQITALREPSPTSEALRQRPDMLQNLRRPPVLLLAALKQN